MHDFAQIRHRLKEKSEMTIQQISSFSLFGRRPLWAVLAWAGMFGQFSADGHRYIPVLWHLCLSFLYMRCVEREWF